MPRTFSLQLLLLGVTVIGAMCGAVVNFPEACLAAVVAAGFIAPAIAICLGSSLFSSRPLRTIAIGLIGALVASLLFPSMRLNGYRGTEYWQYFVENFSFTAIPLAVGALVFCISTVAAYPRWKKSAAEP